MNDTISHIHWSYTVYDCHSDLYMKTSADATLLRIRKWRNLKSDVFTLYACLFDHIRHGTNQPSPMLSLFSLYAALIYLNKFYVWVCCAEIVSVLENLLL